MGKNIDMENNKYSCYVFLADLQEYKDILTVFCKAEGLTKVTALEKVIQKLKKLKSNHDYAIEYLGIIDFHEIDNELIERQEELFDKYDKVWVLNCSYK